MNSETTNVFYDLTGNPVVCGICFNEEARSFIRCTCIMVCTFCGCSIPKPQFSKHLEIHLWLVTNRIEQQN